MQEQKRRLITCSDGTWNKTDIKDRGKPVITNVAKMFKSICPVGEDGVRQLKCYDQGVGTGYSWKDRVIGGATGAGIDQNIKDVYTFLVMNYRDGDEVYIFGFSRGAYTARSLAGFINCCGILKPSYIHLIDTAYKLYRNRNDYTAPDSDTMMAFKANFSYPLKPIKFVGVWDTVGSLGIPLPSYKLYNKHKYKFHDVTLSTLVENAYHALAINERRFLFEPTLWELSKKVQNNPDHPQKMEQRWFAGVHSNVGGGYCDCGLSDIALKWLVDKSKDTGLCFDKTELDILEPDPKGELRNSYTAMYWFWLPVWRKITLNDGITNQAIDDSVWDRYTDPKKLPRNIRDFWKAKQA